MSTAQEDISLEESSEGGNISAKERLLQSISRVRGFERVEELIFSKLNSDARLLEEIPRYLHELGGKRMRPILCLMTSKLFGQKEPSQEVVDVAAGIELIHMATLLHDDIIDNSPLRRHKESPLVRYGTPNTLLAGDFLLVRAFSLCARLDAAIVDATEDACIELTEGEILETSLVETDHNLESSLTICKKKTASLFRLASYSAAHLASGDKRAEELMTTFGENMGIAFQILDDILDVTASEELLGKKAGIDIRERKPSIVNVIWLDSNQNGTAGVLKTKPSSEDDKLVEQALEELKDSPVIDAARELAKSYADKACAALEELSTHPAVVYPDALNDLHAIVDFTIERMG